MVLVLTNDVPPRRRWTAGGEIGLTGVIRAEPAFFKKGALWWDCLLPRTERAVPVCQADLETRGGVPEGNESQTQEFCQVCGRGREGEGILKRVAVEGSVGGVMCNLVGEEVWRKEYVQRRKLDQRCQEKGSMIKVRLDWPYGHQLDKPLRGPDSWGFGGQCSIGSSVGILF